MWQPAVQPHFVRRLPRRDALGGPVATFARFALAGHPATGLIACLKGECAWLPPGIFVIPAEAGLRAERTNCNDEIPAFAGMTKKKKLRGVLPCPLTPPATSKTRSARAR